MVGSRELVSRGPLGIMFVLQIAIPPCTLFLKLRNSPAVKTKKYFCIIEAFLFKISTINNSTQV